MIEGDWRVGPIEARKPSHRVALRSSAIIGGSQVVSIAMGVLRIKLAALVLGPSGIGTIGLLQNVLQTASNSASFGIGTAGTRQIADSAAQMDRQIVVRRALALLTLGCASIGAVITFLFRGQIASWALGDADQARMVGWLAIGVFLTVITIGQNASMIGLRRIGDFARVSIASSTGAAILGVAAILVWRENGIVAFVLATPAFFALIGFFVLCRLPGGASKKQSSTIAKEAVILVKLGAAFAAAGTASALSQLAFRSVLGKVLGIAALGYFQAAWFISVSYVAFVLQAMGAEYYPRLTGAIAKGESPAPLVHEQIEVALGLAGPVLLGTLALAPIIIGLLYSHAFAPAASILRWQILADVFKVASFPLGYLLLAQGRGWTFMALEVGNNVVMLAMLVWLLPIIGIEASGIAVLLSYVAYLASVAVAVWRPSGLTWRSKVVGQFAALLASATTTLIVAALNFWISVFIGLTLAGLFAVLSLRRLDHALPLPVRRLARRLYLLPKSRV